MTVTDHSRSTADTAHTHGAAVPASSRAERTRSFDLNDFPKPRGREEEWRFTPLDRLEGVLGEGEERPNGRATWSLERLPAGLTITQIEAEEARRRSVNPASDRAGAAAVIYARRGILLSVEPQTRVEDPVEIGIRVENEQVRGFVVVETGEGADLTIIVRISGTMEMSSFVSIDVADRASLTVVFVYECDKQSVNMSDVVARLGTDSRLKIAGVMLGGSVSRVNTSVALTGEGGSVELFGVNFTEKNEHHENRVFVDHVAPRCRSRVTYKGALAGDGARSVWVGDVLIRGEAEGTDTYELNRNLILTDGARADSIPNLEIETGNIQGAGHASATGRFDDEQLFYLESRGITEAEARKLVVRGFFADVLHQIGVPHIERELLLVIEKELEAVHD